MATLSKGTVLTCAHEGCGCRLVVEVPCGCDGATGEYTCDCGTPMVPVSG